MGQRNSVAGRIDCAASFKEEGEEREAAYEGPGVVQATCDQRGPCLVISCWPTDRLDALQINNPVHNKHMDGEESAGEREQQRRRGSEEKALRLYTIIVVHVHVGVFEI